MTFGHTITLWCSWWREFVKLFHIVLIEDQTRNSNIRLPNQIIETLFSCYDDFPLHSKFFELFKCFRLMFHQVDIPISVQIIYEGQKITIPATSINTHRTAYIRKINSQLSQVVVVPRHSEYMFTDRTILLHLAAVELIGDFISLNPGICLKY